MAAHHRHIIQKQVLEVDMENPADAFQLRNRLGEVYYEKILPQLDVLFDEIGTDNRLIRIDQLYIDVGDISSKNWEEELAEKTIHKIRQSLILENPQWENSSGTNINSPTITKQQGEFIEVFLFFLQTGRLPWFAMNNTECQSALRKWMSAETVEPLKTYLKTADTSQLLRLIYQLDKSLLDELIKFFISPQHHAFYDQFIEAKNLLSGHLRSLFVTEPVIKKLLYLAFFKWLSVEDSDDLNLFYSKEISTSFQNEFPGILKQAVFGETIRKIKDNIILKNIDELISSASFAKKDEPLKDKKIEPVDQLYIENAGLVLLHPFLQPLFKNIHLTTNDQFADEYAAMKAVLLTQFVVYGSGVFEEHQLVLNKILCGYSLDEPIIKELEISEEEKKEATDLLHQVMQLWKKNNVRVTVTRESLQHSFLQRQGKLVQKEKDWQLHIEQKPYDMVLSSLPWGIGIIKTPWMKGMLWVDWA